MPRLPSAIRRIPQDTFKMIVSQSSSYAEMIRRLALKGSSGTQTASLIRICRERDIDLTHVKGRAELTALQIRRQSEQAVADWLANVPGFIPVIKGWQASLREPLRAWLFQRVDHRCERCGWNEKHPDTGVVPLQVHHVDGDAMHNRPENLKVLCPNCHSLTPNFGRRNRNGKRKGRYAGKS